MSDQHVGDLQHRIPAGLIGGFSEELNGSRRKRHVYVQSRSMGTSREQVKKLTRGRGVFDSAHPNGPTLERLWPYFEPELPGLIDKLSNDARYFIEAMNNHEIIRILVPYMASAAMRGMVYDSYHQEWVNALRGQDVPIDGPNPLIHVEVNHSRQYVFRKMTGRLLQSEWRFDYAPDGSRFILNDLGWAVSPTPDFERVGILFPLSPRLAVWVDRIGGAGDVRVNAVSPEQVRRANELLAAQTWDSIYGCKLRDILEVDLGESRSRDLPLPETALFRDGQEEWTQGLWQALLDSHGLPFPSGLDRVEYFDSEGPLGRVMLILHDPNA